MNITVGIPFIYGENSLAGWIAGFYYIKNCINALATLAFNERPHIKLFVPHYFNEKILHSQFDNTNQWLEIIRINCQPNGFSFDLQNMIDNHPCDVYFPFNSLPKFQFKGAMIGWIPDFQHKHLSHLFSQHDITSRELESHFILKYSDMNICSSQNVLDDIIHFYPELCDKNVKIPFRSILDSDALPALSSCVLHKFDIKRKFILLSNQFWMHKNHKLVFEAWKILKDQNKDFLLVCTGASQDYRNADYYRELMDFIKTHNLNNHICILGFIDRHEQIQLMRHAAAILQPSLFEGWNTTIEDAKALGKKLIVSDINVHREQCGNSVYYFDKSAPKELADVISQNWEHFPCQYDATNEKQAQQIYELCIQEFGKSLMQVFRQAIIKHASKSKMNERELILNLTSQLQMDNAHLTARLNIIQQLKTELETIKKSLAAENLLKKQKFKDKCGKIIYLLKKFLKIDNKENINV